MRRVTERIPGCLAAAALLAGIVAAPGIDSRHTRGPGALDRQTRRAARKLDRALIRIDRSVLGAGGGQIGAAARHLRRAQKHLRDSLDDPDLLSASGEIDEALAVLADPSFMPQQDITPLLEHTGAARDLTIASDRYAETHADGVFYLGRTRKFDGFRFQDRDLIPLGVNGPFSVLEIRASGGSLFVDRIKIFFEDGDLVASQSNGSVDRLRSGENDRIDLHGRFILLIRVNAITTSEDSTDRAALKLWGIALE